MSDDILDRLIKKMDTKGKGKWKKSKTDCGGCPEDLLGLI